MSAKRVKSSGFVEFSPANPTFTEAPWSVNVAGENARAAREAIFNARASPALAQALRTVAAHKNVRETCEIVGIR